MIASTPLVRVSTRTQIKALDRTQPVLPLAPGVAER